MKINKFDYNTKKDIFFDVFSDMRDEEEVYDDSFSNGMYQYDNIRIEEQIKNFEEKAEENGLNVPKFMSEYKDTIYSDSSFTLNSGFIDAILYKYDKQKGILAGYQLNESSNEEYYMKYSYGYYKYDMGRNFILQSYNTMDDYFKDTAKLFLVGFFDSMYGCDEEVTLKNEIVKNYKIGYVVFANLKQLFKNSQERHYERFLNDIIDDLKNSVEYIDIINDVLVITINVDEFNINDVNFEEITEDFEVLNQSDIYNL